MKCTYIYKNKISFNNEEQLDDFILNNGIELYSKYGDLTLQTSYAARIVDNIKNEAKLYQDKFSEAKKHARYIEEEVLDFKPPYVGVNKFIKGLRNERGNLLTPEFIDIEYWSRRIKKWLEEGFNEDEFTILKQTFGESVQAPTEQVNLQLLLEFLDGSDFESDNPTLDCIGKIREYWWHQGKVGTEIHDVLKYLFTTIKNGENKGLLRLTLNKKLLTKNILEYHSKLETYLTEDLVIDIIDYAINLKKELEATLGNNLLFYPELLAVGKLQKEVEDKGDTILGILDLLVIDSQGKAHIIDYKASPKTVFASAKERTFWYQLGLYHRILRQHGLSFSDERATMIAPIYMDGFHKDLNGDFKIRGMKATNPQMMLNDITNNATRYNVRENLDEFIPINVLINLPPEEVSENMKKFNNTLFVDLDSNTDVDIKKWIDRKGGILLDKNTGKYYIQSNDYSLSFVGETEEEVVGKVTKYITEIRPKKLRDFIDQTKIAFRNAIKYKTSDVEIPTAKNVDSEKGGTGDWLRRFISKYANGNYIIEDSDVLESYGVLMLVNTVTKQRDLIKITIDDLRQTYSFNGNLLITGSFISDRILARKQTDVSAADINTDQNSLLSNKTPQVSTLIATKGNIHAMQVMALLNCMPTLTQDGSNIGEIHVINPMDYLGNPPISREELLYNFNQLIEHVDGFDNNINKLNFADTLTLMRNKLAHILSFLEGNTYKRFQLYKNILTDLDSAISTQDESKALSALWSLAKELEAKFGNLLELNLDTYDESQNPARALYERVMVAIANIKGISFKQHIAPKSRGVQFANGGVLSLMMDNPGNLDNDTLNNLVTLVTQAYLNVREEVLMHMKTIRELTNKVKEVKGFNRFKEMTYGNMASIYNNLIYMSNGDLLFKNPWDPMSDIETLEEREFLKYALEIINKNRFSDNINIQIKRDSGDPSYFRVPLAKGDTLSAYATFGSLTKALTTKLKRLDPRYWWDDALKKALGIFSENQDSDDDRKLFEMTNMFNETDLETRLNRIRDYGEEYFEKNIETLLIKHIFAYSLQKHINEVMPMAKASMVHLVVQGNISNLKYKSEARYITEYIKNKIKNLNINDHPELWNAVGKIRSAASFLILAFNPVLYPGQLIQGMLQDIRIVWQNLGNDDTPYTLKNFRKAWGLLYTDMFKLGGKPTKCSLLNEFFGMNDMDMNTYADKIKSDRYGIFNFTNIAFHCASRPDYFNRMSLFIAQMMQDGVWEAYEINSKGELVYNFKKDSRFSYYANNDSTSNPQEYNKQKALYEVMARQLINEGALNKDGSKFVMGKPLPKAYTNKQIESFKSFSDTLYGYYTHEKKAMIHAYGWGALWMQMRTFWSGKKNQYLGSQGVKLLGKYVHQKNSDGKLMYYKLEEGKLIPTTEITDQPILKWEGQWQEGILCSLRYLIHDIKDRGWKVTIQELRDNPEYAVQYANLKQLAYDMIMFMVVGSIMSALMGDWSELVEKEAKKSGNIDDGLMATVALVSMKSVNYGFLDFNFFESIGGPFWNIEPVSINYISSRVGDLWDCIEGDKSFKNALTRISSVTANSRPLINAIFD